MIAANYRKHPEAMAVQLVLKFGRCVWHTTRPTTRIGRQLRAQVSATFARAEKIQYPAHKPTPHWVRALARSVRTLGKLVQMAQIRIDFRAEAPEEWAGW